tara:strand:+ start:311 stop:493 length:183 start_codon:yes stop_codon:yes gene_type:complete
VIIVEEMVTFIVIIVKRVCGIAKSVMKADGTVGRAMVFGKNTFVGLVMEMGCGMSKIQIN